MEFVNDVDEEVTYESTGILPPEEYYKEENYE